VQDSRDVFFGLDLVDRVYLDTEPETLLHVGSGAAVSVENTAGWTDTVIWNPHTNMKECYKNFCCVESAAVSRPVVVAPGKVWRAETNLTVIDVVSNDV
jgi:glucose-6-phosphate 1-epimerase